MKKIIILLLLLIPLNVNAVEINATSAILMDQDSKRILYSKDIHNIRSVASISKIMTAIVAIENGNLNKKIIVGDEIKNAYGSGIYIKEKEKLTLEDLLYGLMLRSGNDAALVIADNVGKTVPKFVDKMNLKAKEIGMKNSTFNNPSGLDEEKGNFSTAYDMALLMSYAMKNDEFKKIVGTRKYNLKTNKNTYVWYNKNKLLKSYQYTTGGKTGYTKKARRTLVSSATKNNFNLTVVTLNDGNDFKDHQNLYDYGFENYEKVLILKKGNINIKNEKIYKNKKIFIKRDIYYPLTENEKNNLLIDYKLDKKRKIKNNSKIGQAIIKIGDKEIDRVNLYISKKSIKGLKNDK